MNGWMHEWMAECINGWMYEWLNARMAECMNYQLLNNIHRWFTSISVRCHFKSWTRFDPGLSWARFDPGLSWARFDPGLSWARFDPGLSWARFDPGLSWTRFDPGLSWARFDPGLSWARFDPGLSWARFDPAWLLNNHKPTTSPINMLSKSWMALKYSSDLITSSFQTHHLSTKSSTLCITTDPPPPPRSPLPIRHHRMPLSELQWVGTIEMYFSALF